jgi:hypothetical protein
MKRLIVAGCSFAMLVAVAGCKSDKNGDADRPRMSQREVMNRSKLEAYPDAVGAGFMRDYPTANVTSVDVFNDATGRAVYEINFVRDGRAEDAVYTAEGTRVTAPVDRVAPPPPAGAPAPPRQPAPPTR